MHETGTHVIDIQISENIIIFYNCKTHMHEHSTMISYKLN